MVDFGLVECVYVGVDCVVFFDDGFVEMLKCIIVEECIVIFILSGVGDCWNVIGGVYLGCVIVVVCEVVIEVEECVFGFIYCFGESLDVCYWYV